MESLEKQKTPNVLFLSTYPPRACGIATFTQDLVNALKETGECAPGIVAVNDGAYSYPPEVKFTLEQQDPNSYLETAERINASSRRSTDDRTRIWHLRRKIRRISAEADGTSERFRTS